MKSEEFRNSRTRAVTLLGMSGSGKTTLASKLPRNRWFHYSGDYRIGTRYLDEPILDNVKKEAMKIPFLADLLRTDSIYLCHNITISNLAPIASFLGMIGDPAKDGLLVEEFKRRQALHRDAEIAAMYDVREFILKARDTYGYPHFINDAGGSLCELNESEVIRQLAEDTLIVYLKPSDVLLDKIIERSLLHPKPMYYQDGFLDDVLPQYLEQEGLSSSLEIVPEEFFSWMFPSLVEHRLPLYKAIADTYGVVVEADRIDSIEGEEDFVELICEALT
jgi:GTPase SAR1 family protein